MYVEMLATCVSNSQGIRQKLTLTTTESYPEQRPSMSCHKISISASAQEYDNFSWHKFIVYNAKQGWSNASLGRWCERPADNFKIFVALNGGVDD